MIIKIGDNMSDNNINELIADMTNRVSQYKTWANDYHSSTTFQHQMAEMVSAECVNLIAQTEDIENMDVEAVSDLARTINTTLISFKQNLSLLRDESNNIPSPMRKGGASKIDPAVLSVYDGLTKHFTDALLPAFEEVWSVLGETVRVSGGQGGMTYIEAGKTAKDYVNYYVNRVVDNPTKGANRIHAKGYSTADLSDEEFLQENGLFNRLYLTTDDDGKFVTKEIDGVTTFVLGHTMVNPKYTGGNS